jgi:hypothetical protein
MGWTRAAAESKSSAASPFSQVFGVSAQLGMASLDFGHEAQHSCIYESQEQQIRIFALA